ncbi:MAG: FMN-dependent dehydrogenase, partial [Lachnospiraceae bacterium]|nr:FMN-dependent dehydrogenase [Lachnospiraceae bacterium]
MTKQVNSENPQSGVIPLTEGNAADANVYNRTFLDSIHVEMSIIDSTEVDTSIELFGRKYDTPIMTPAFS